MREFGFKDSIFYAFFYQYTAVTDILSVLDRFANLGFPIWKINCLTSTCLGNKPLTYIPLQSSFLSFSGPQMFMRIILFIWLLTIQEPSDLYNTDRSYSHLSIPRNYESAFNLNARKRVSHTLQFIGNLTQAKLVSSANFVVFQEDVGRYVGIPYNLFQSQFNSMLVSKRPGRICNFS